MSLEISYFFTAKRDENFDTRSLRSPLYAIFVLFTPRKGRKTHSELAAESAVHDFRTFYPPKGTKTSVL